MKNLNTIALGSAVALLVAMMLPWASVEMGGMKLSINGWEMKTMADAPSLGLVVLVLSGLGAALTLLPKKIGTILGLVLSVLGLGLALLVMFVTIPHNVEMAVERGGSGGAGIGMYLALAACIGVLVGCVMGLGKFKKA